MAAGHGLKARPLPLSLSREGERGPDAGGSAHYWCLEKRMGICNTSSLPRPEKTGDDIAVIPDLIRDRLATSLGPAASDPGARPG